MLDKKLKKIANSTSPIGAIQQLQHCKPELLMPAGNFEKLMTAFRYGADACYLGLPDFSLRYRENQIRQSDIGKAILYAREMNKKIYVTLNTFPHNQSITKIIEHLKYLRTVGPDAIIFSDPGVFNLIKKYYSSAKLHLSVQATATNYETVKFWKNLGLERVILARELSLKEIAQIHKQVPDIQLESFVHGAMCMSYSGRCLLSNYLTSRDANQGDCAHPCRWNYQVKEYILEEGKRQGEYFPIFENQHGIHILSSQDMCLIKYLKKIWNAGVVSFKIEGRAKNVSYAATIARAYRQAIDDMINGRRFNKKLLNEVKTVSNRGFCTGFYFGKPTLEHHQTFANRTEGTYDFIGIVRGFDQKTMLATIEVKGRIKLGDQIEIVTPQKIIKQKVKNMYDLSGKKINHYNPGLTDPVLIKFNHNITTDDILRKKINL